MAIAMHMLFVIDNLSTGGAQRQMVNLALALSRREHQIEVFCYYPQDQLASPLRERHIPVWMSIKKHRFSLGTISALRKRVAKGKYDLVLSYLTTPNFYSIVSSLSMRHRPKIVVSERWCDPPQGIDPMVRFVRQFYRFSDHVVANSLHQRDSLIECHRWLNGRVSTIYNGYDLSLFCPTLTRTRSDNLRILVIASVSPWKNGLCLIEALKLLRAQNGLTPVVNWVGQQVMHGYRLEYLHRMERAIADSDLCGQWHWLKQRSDIVDLMNSHDVLVHPSWAEGLPNVVCESLACGLPVIVTNTLDHPRIIEDGHTGFLFDWRRPEDLAEALLRFHTLSLDQRRAMSIQARTFAESHLSMDSFAEKYEALFRSICLS